MATRVYESGTITLIDGTELYITPLKLKYLRDFMDIFQTLSDIKDQDEYLDQTIECVRIAMQQYYPSIKTAADVEDNLDLATMNQLLAIAAGAKQKEKEGDESKEEKDKTGGWDKLDLAHLESEVFLLGIWKDYEELEASLSMPELVAILNVKRDLDYKDKKFLAAIQGVDLDKQSGKNDAWEKMKARVFSGGKARDADDVLALQGANAAKVGFGIGMGLSYENVGKK